MDFPAYKKVSADIGFPFSSVHTHIIIRLCILCLILKFHLFLCLSGMAFCKPQSAPAVPLEQAFEHVHAALYPEL